MKWNDLVSLQYFKKNTDVLEEKNESLSIASSEYSGESQTQSGGDRNPKKHSARPGYG